MQSEPRRLSFLAIEDRLKQLESKDPLGFSRDRWVLISLTFGALLTLPSVYGIKTVPANWAALLGVAFEVVAGALLVVRQVRDVVPDFVEASRTYASELDAAFPQHEETLAWLGSMPVEERARALAYIESRLDSFSQRYPILFGPTDKLGILPGVVGLFVQLQSIKAMSLLMWFFGLFIVAFFLMGLWMARYRLQLQTYARLLRSSQQEAS